MRILLNGDEREVPDGATVASLLEQLGLPADQVAVELNRELVARALRDTTTLSEGDRLEVVTLVGGG